MNVQHVEERTTERKPPTRNGQGWQCGACHTPMLQQRPPGRLLWCINDKCQQRNVPFTD